MLNETTTASVTTIASKPSQEAAKTEADSTKKGIITTSGNRFVKPKIKFIPHVPFLWQCRCHLCQSQLWIGHSLLSRCPLQSFHVALVASFFAAAHSFSCHSMLRPTVSTQQEILWLAFGCSLNLITKKPFQLF